MSLPAALSVRRLTLLWIDAHQLGMRVDVSLDDGLGLCDGFGIAGAIEVVGRDEIALVRRRRVVALVNRRDRAGGHAGPAVDALLGMDVEHRGSLELGLVLPRVD